MMFLTLFLALLASFWPSFCLSSSLLLPSGAQNLANFFLNEHAGLAKPAPIDLTGKLLSPLYCGPSYFTATPKDPSSFNLQLLYFTSSLLTFKGPASAFGPGCLMNGQPPEADGFYSISRILTAPVKISGGLPTFYVRVPKLDDVYSSGSVSFTKENIEVLRTREVEEEELGNELEMELNAAGTVQTAPFGFNYNEKTRGARGKLLTFNNIGGFKFNCSGCFIATTLGATVELSWDIKNPSKNRFFLEIFSDIQYSYNFGISAALPNPKLEFRRTLKTIPVLEDKFLTFIGPVPISISADLEFNVVANLQIPASFDTSLWASGFNHIEAGMVSDGKSPGGRTMPIVVTKKVPGVKGVIHPNPLEGRVGLEAKFSIRLDRLMALNFKTGPSFKLSTINNLLYHPGACKVPDVLMPRRNLPAPLQVVGASLARVILAWDNVIDISPVEVKIFNFQWTPWTITLHAFPTITIFEVFSACLPLNNLMWRITNIQAAAVRANKKTDFSLNSVDSAQDDENENLSRSVSVSVEVSF